MTASACVSPGIWSVAADHKCSRLVHQDDSNNQTPQLRGKGEKKYIQIELFELHQIESVFVFICTASMCVHLGWHTVVAAVRWIEVEHRVFL